jgi:hypothetical protein
MRRARSELQNLRTVPWLKKATGKFNGRLKRALKSAVCSPIKLQLREQKKNIRRLTAGLGLFWLLRARQLPSSKAAAGPRPAALCLPMQMIHCAAQPSPRAPKRPPTAGADGPPCGRTCPYTRLCRSSRPGHRRDRQALTGRPSLAGLDRRAFTGSLARCAAARCAAADALCAAHGAAGRGPGSADQAGLTGVGYQRLYQRIAASPPLPHRWF